MPHSCQFYDIALSVSHKYLEISTMPAALYFHIYHEGKRQRLT